MILVLAGTRDGRELVTLLLSQGYRVTASTASEYGAKLLAAIPAKTQLTLNDRPLDENGLLDFMKERGVALLVDASHPYAANVSQNAMRACRLLKIPYLRYERPETHISDENIFLAADYSEAAAKAAELGKNVFITTGSRNLEKLVKSPYLSQCRLVVRVLPSAEVIADCIRLGLTPGQIAALQGPFSREFNREIFRHYQAEVIISKNSGQVGGTDTKIAAAQDLNIPLVLIERPKVNYDFTAKDFDEVLSFVEKWRSGKGEHIGERQG